MKYKVCIMAAGKGIRLSHAKNFNKALVPVGEKSTLSYIIDKFPKNVEIIIAVGFNSHLIKEFVNIAYSDRKITLVDVDNYEGPGSGPGHSLYCCSKHLQCPFIFTSVDTIVLEDIPEPKINWIGVARGESTENYCMVDVREGLAKRFYIKMPLIDILKYCYDLEAILNNVFIGMAGVFDYLEFWNSFKKQHKLVEGEVQVMDGLEGLVNKSLYPHQFTWFDTGNDASYYFTNKYFSKLNLLVKPDEFIYFEKDLVIKYFADRKIFSDRIKRANLLKGIVPEIIKSGDGFYAYRFVPGLLLSQVNDVAVFGKFLDFCLAKIWKPVVLGKKEQKLFSNVSKIFYFDKTKKRLDLFYKNTNIKDKKGTINGISVPSLTYLLDQIDWDNLAKGEPVLFHGDLQPENIIVKKSGEFQLIDWRQNFEGLIEYGDIYYDFAKLYHALIISNKVVRQNGFEVKNNGEDVNLNFLIQNNLCEFKQYFEKFLTNSGYDLNKVKLISGLVFLNIAALSNYPYNIFLYYIGKLTVYQQLYGRKN